MLLDVVKELRDLFEWTREDLGLRSDRRVVSSTLDTLSTRRKTQDTRTTKYLKHLEDHERNAKELLPASDEESVQDAQGQVVRECLHAREQRHEPTAR